MLSFIPSPVLLRASLAPRPLRLAPIPLPHNEIGAAWSDLPSVLAAAAASQPLPFLSKGAWANTEAEFWEPIYLSTMAGLSTCIGASVAFVVDATKPEGDDGDAAATSSRAVGVGPDLLAFSLALAGSVMVTVCVVSIIPEALSLDFDGADGETTWSALGQDPSQLILQRGAGFAAGWGVYALLSRMLSALPEQDEWGSYLVGDGASTSFDADDDTRTQTSTQSTTKQASWRLTILLFLSLLLHNFPEGLAVAFSAASSLPSSSSVVSTEIEPATSALSAIATGISSLGGGMSSVSSHPLVSSSIMIPAHETLAPAASTSSLASIVTLSIALHNIPEGLAIAIPCLAARPDQPFLAFGLASLSGLAEPVGAFIGLTVLRLRGADALAKGQDMNDALAFVAGIMMAVAVCELLPEAARQREDCDTPRPYLLGVAMGVGLMVLTELYLGA